MNSYNRWMRFKKSSELIFKSFDLCLTQNEESSLSFSNSELFDELSKNLPCDDQNQLKSMKNQ